MSVYDIYLPPARLAQTEYTPVLRETVRRLDGRPAVADYFRTFFAGKIDIPRYEILNPQVIADGDLAVLSYNLANYVRAEGGSETAGTSWNSTQVYRRKAMDGGWPMCSERSRGIRQPPRV